MAAQAVPRSRSSPLQRFWRGWFGWLTWPRLVLLTLLVAYWLFVRGMERVDGTVVVVRFLLPDLTPGQAASVSLSPGLQTLAQLIEFLHPRVLRHFVPIFVGWYLAVQAAVSLMQVLYNCPDRATAADFLRRQRRDRVAYMELPFVVLPHDLESIREGSILLRVGGPVQVIIPNGYAGVTERNARYQRPLPPGYHILGRFEYLLGIIDLQPQSRSASGVSLVTKEGLRVKSNVGLTFRVDPGGEPSHLNPYPFVAEAVRKAAYSGVVGSNGQVNTWDSAPLGRAIGAMSGWVSSHTIDELLATDASHDAHHLMTQAVIEKVWDQNGLLKEGIKPLRVHVGRLTPDDEISKQYVELWLASQEKGDRLVKAEGTAQLTKELETLRAEGEMLIIQAVVEALRRTQQGASSRISGYVLAMSLVEALRQMLHLNGGESSPIAAGMEHLEDEISVVTQRLSGLEESLKLPTTSFNPSKPD